MQIASGRDGKEVGRIGGDVGESTLGISSDNVCSSDGRCGGADEEELVVEAVGGEDVAVNLKFHGASAVDGGS